ncbi:MAG: hypothetical protein M3Z24_06710 [Chloroflexota bacterium]|nr:hypothetical protein [Chloroflexota bacterium]
MGFHIGNRVEVVIAQGTEPALDSGVNGVGIGKDVGSRDRATYLIGLLQGNPGTDSGQGQSAPASPALIRAHLGDTSDCCLNSPVPRAHHMPEREAEQIGLGEGTGRPFGLGEIVSARMKKLVDSIELRLYQGDSVHTYSAFLKNVIGVSRDDGVKGMQSRASAPTIKTMDVRIFQLRMAKRVGEKLHTSPAFSTSCQHFKKDPWRIAIPC